MCAACEAEIPEEVKAMTEFLAARIGTSRDPRRAAACFVACGAVFLKLAAANGPETLLAMIRVACALADVPLLAGIFGDEDARVEDGGSVLKH